MSSGVDLVVWYMARSIAFASPKVMIIRVILKAVERKYTFHPIIFSNNMHLNEHSVTSVEQAEGIDRLTNWQDNLGVEMVSEQIGSEIESY